MEQNHFHGLEFVICSYTNMCNPTPHISPVCNSSTIELLCISSFPYECDIINTFTLSSELPSQIKMTLNSLGLFSYGPALFLKLPSNF